MAVYDQLHRRLTATTSCSPLWYFERFQFFDGLTARQGDAVTAAAARLRIAHGRPLDLRGAGDDVFIVRAGSVDIANVAFDGRQTTLTRLWAGDVFGACDVPDGGSLGQTAEARGDCALLVVPAPLFARSVADAPGLQVHIVRAVNGRPCSFRRRVDTLVLRCAEARLAQLFIDLAREHGCASDDGLFVPPALTYGDVGQLVGLSADTVRQMLRSWCLMGVIETLRGMLRLCDPGALRRVAAGGALVPHRPGLRRAARPRPLPATLRPMTATASSAHPAPAGRILPPAPSIGSRRLSPA